MRFKRCHCSSEIPLLRLRLKLEVNFSFGGLLEQLSARLEDTPTGFHANWSAGLTSRSFDKTYCASTRLLGFDYASLSPMARLFFMCFARQCKTSTLAASK